LKKNVSGKDIVIETMPFPNELKAWCYAHTEFLAVLKNVYLAKFISLNAIATSYPTQSPQDQVIGVYTHDCIRKNPIFKQDFIVNKEFTLYTINKNGNNSKYVKDISRFYQKNGTTGDCVNSHHLTLDQLPEELRPRGIHAIDLANKIVAKGTVRKTSKKLIEIKKNPTTM